MVSYQQSKTIKRLLSRERQVRKLHDGGDPTVCLAYPNTYRVGMASLGFQVVRRIMIEHGCRVERTFMPPGLGTAKKPNLSPLSAWESGSLASAFQVLAFSAPFELDFLNLCRMLFLSGIPPKAADRHQGHPLVVAGGAAVTINPRPLDRFLDVVVLGESELLIPRLVETVRSFRGDREALLSALAEQEGFYLPAYHEDYRTRFAAPPRLEDAAPAISDYISPDAEFADAVLIEVGRGCSMGCRFCWAGWACRPIRSYSVPKILAAVDQLPADVDRIGLIAASHYDHAGFRELLSGLRKRAKRIILSALRIDQTDTETLRLLSESRTQSVAIAPETGTEELRRAVGKRFSDKQILRAAARVSAAGLRSLKLYFLVGLPHETDADVDAIPTLTSKVQEAAGPEVSISLSVNIFIPKPGSPWGGQPLGDEKELKRKIRRLKRTVSSLSPVEINTMAPWQAALQTLLSRGGSEVGEYLLRTAREGKESRFVLELTPPELLQNVLYSAQSQDEAGPVTA